ncbi:hypothetical protein [Thiorhodococcus minor]|uniref:Uncharacterized protein n=1 Tax=Thiorhodococcus minor TaxID=57489 RepID=A0A6M0JS52_9GAMM|nr:hypothetical protein [Thiorhodococcus minor]NEV60350.1 hypothetical protein [Thiorhodococcus minor]
MSPIPADRMATLAAMQTVDIHLPITNVRTLIFSRYTEPQADQTSNYCSTR